MKNIIKFEYTCVECESKKVSNKVWIDLNTDEILDSASFDIEDYWCDNCNAHVQIKSKKET